MEIVNFKPSGIFKEKADKLFEQQKAVLKEQIPQADIQHVGGTSIPELLTKGDLDINIRLNQKDFYPAVETLKELYEINQLANWTETFASFKDDDSFELPVGIQVTIIDGPEDYFVKQREILSSNPLLIEKINNIKKDFEGGDVEEYRKAKSQFYENNFN